MSRNYYEVEVRPGRGSEFFQYYTETVEALTDDDALKKVQRRNPGCECRITNGWSESENSGSAYSSDSSGSGGCGGCGTGCRSGCSGIVFTAIAIIVFAMLNGGDDNKKKKYQPATSTPSAKEQVQKSSSGTAPAKDQPSDFSVRELPRSTPTQYRAEESACDIWRKAQPALAARLQPGDKCYR